MTLRSSGPAVPGSTARVWRACDRREDPGPLNARERADDLLERLAWRRRRRSLELENLRGAGTQRTRDIRQDRRQLFFVLAVQRIARAQPHHEVHEHLPQPRDRHRPRDRQRLEWIAAPQHAPAAQDVGELDRERLGRVRDLALEQPHDVQPHCRPGGDDRLAERRNACRVERTEDHRQVDVGRRPKAVLRAAPEQHNRPQIRFERSCRRCNEGGERGGNWSREVGRAIDGRRVHDVAAGL